MDSHRFALVAGVLLSVALPQPVLAKVFACKPVQVSDSPKSCIHVQCAPADGPIAFFALSVSDSNEANRVMSLAAAGLTAGRSLYIFYDPNDTNGAAFGCQSNDCRLIQGLELN